jgi:hypothetical protein
MRKRSSPLSLAPVRSFVELIQRMSNHFGWSPFRQPIPTTVDAPTFSTVDRQPTPLVDAGHLGPTCVHERAGHSRYLAERLYSKLARALGLGAHSGGFALQNAPRADLNDQTLKRFESGGDADLQLTLILESLELLNLTDAQVIRARLAGRVGKTASQHSVIDPHDLDIQYGLAVIRFSTRLVWVAGQESLGASPSQRRALGLVKFQMLTAQVVADRLGLPLEVVKYWVREGDLLSVTE